MDGRDSGRCGTAFTLHEALAKSYRRGDVPRRSREYNFHRYFSDLRAHQRASSAVVTASSCEAAGRASEALKSVPQNGRFERVPNLRLPTEEALKMPPCCAAEIAVDPSLIPRTRNDAPVLGVSVLPEGKTYFPGS
jgi:hypothetical protein